MRADAVAATRRHKAGLRSYAKRAREVEREEERDTKKRRGEAILTNAIVPIMQAAGPVPLENLPESLTSAWADVAAARECQRCINDEAATVVKAWTNTKGVHVRDALVTAVPALATQAPSMAGELGLNAGSVVKWELFAEELLPRTIAVLKKDKPQMLAQCLSDWTEGLHRLVRHEEQASIPPPPVKK